MNKTNNNKHIQSNTINPPKLNEVSFDSKNKIKQLNGNIHEGMVCFRPTHNKSFPAFNDSLIDGKRVIANYGHGGGGWTISWATIFNTIATVDIKQLILTEEKIAVVGSGIIGLGTVLYLIHLGIKPSNITIYTKETSMITSDKSGAMFTLTVKGKDEEDQKRIENLKLDTFSMWKKIHDGNDKELNSSTVKWAELKDCLHLIPAYYGAEKEVGTVEYPTGMDLIADKGLIPPIELVKLKIKNTNKEHLMRKAYTFHFQTVLLIKTMLKIALSLNVHVKLGEVTNEKIKYLNGSTIFSCAGLGSKEIINDKEMRPVAGHVIHLNNQPVGNFDLKNKFLMLTQWKSTKDSEKRMFLYMPKIGPGYSGIIGTSKYDGYHGGDDDLDQKNYYELLKTAREVFGGDVNSIPVPKF